MTHTDFQFRPETLRAERKPGLSGFMRIRNGEDWLEAAVTSHLPYMDEIVAVYNGCTDRTPEILERLQLQFPERIRVFHYKPRVHPVGSAAHIRTPAGAVNSIANYYNYALSMTRYRIATKLDDDHVAMPPAWARIRRQLEERQFRLGSEYWTFSGLNLVRHQDEVKVHALVPFAGNGDHWFFEVNPRRYFTKDRRFERFNRRGMRMRFKGIAYWHLKYLKKDHGFASYELDANPGSRYHKQKARFLAGKEGIDLEQLGEQCRRKVRTHGFKDRLKACLSSKQRLRMEREAAFDVDLMKKELEFLRESVLTSERA